MMADTDVTKMKVADLKRELKLRGLITTGNKLELVERLQTSILEGDSILDDNPICEELLEDDVLDDETDDETKSLLDSNHEDAVLKTPPESTTSKSPDFPMGLDNINTQKKVILKRKLMTSILSNKDTIIGVEANTQPSLNTPTTRTDTQSLRNIEKKTINITSGSGGGSGVGGGNGSDVGVNDDGTDKKVVKLSKLSVKERLEMRVKKFGATIPPDAVKLARAERFGLSGATDAALGTNADSSENNSSIDLLKKRAERFGSSVSKVMNTIENKEKLQKRQERFGGGVSGNRISININNNNSSNIVINDDSGKTLKPSNDIADKARQRLERFKTIPAVK